MKYLKIFKLKEILFVLDRGFFSKSNVLELNKDGENVKFILPLPFRLKKVKALLKKNKKGMSNPLNSFKYKEEILFHLKDSLEIDGQQFEAHVYLNEKAELDQRHGFLSCLLDIENRIKGKKFETLREYMTYKKSEIPEKYADYFKWNKKTLKIEKNIRRIRERIFCIGNFILLTNEKEMNKTDVLDHYRRKDSVEKIFNTVKNELDGGRLRAHDNYHNEGRLFVKFIALILYTEISKTMNKKKLFGKYSLKEMMAELTKLKVTTIDDNEPILGELTKKQKIIFKAFHIGEEEIAFET